MFQTIDVNYFNDAPKWDESKHPRGKGAKGGQFVKKGQEGGPSPTMAKVPIPKFVAQELAKGTPLSELSQKLKEVTKEHINKQYIDKIYGQLEKKHGLPKGSLKSGYGHYSGAKPTPTPPAPTPAPTPAPQPTQVPGTGTTSMQIATILAAPGKTAYTKATEIAALVKDKPDGIKSLASKVLENLEKTSGATPGAYTGLIAFKPPGQSTFTPADFSPPQSQHQTNLLNIATGSGTPQEKIDKITNYPTVQNTPQGYTAKYAKELVEKMGGTWTLPDPNQQPTPTPSKPTPTPQPTQQPDTIVPSNPKPWYKKMRQQWEAAFVPSHDHWDQGQAEQCFESAKKDQYAKYKGTTKSAITSYTGAGYDNMNDALRDPTTASPGVVHKVDALLEAFEEDHSVVLKDTKVWRGTHYDAKEVAKMKAALKLGLPYTAKLDGFTSCSFFKSQPAGIGAGKPYWFEIVATAGTKAVAAKLGSGHPEGEILLEHGQNYRVLEVTENWQSPGHGKKTRIRVITVGGGGGGNQ